MRTDPNNRSHVWADPDIGGLLMLRADFTTQGYAPHVHDELVIAVTEQGGSEFQSRGERQEAEPDTVLAFNPGEPHSGRMGASDRWRYRAFYFARDAMDAVAADLELAPGTLPYFAGNKLRDRALCRDLVALHDIAERRAPPLQKRARMVAALACLFARHGAPAPPRRRLGDERARIATVLDHMADRYADEIALGDLARVAGMSTFHLIRSFNKVVGLSPHAWLTQTRVSRALDLLKAGGRPADVAVAVGFYDQSALNHHFKRIHGTTPGQYVAALRA